MVKKVPIAVLASGNGSNLQALLDFAGQAHSHFSVAVVLSNVKEAFALTRAERAKVPNFLLEHQRFLRRQDFELAMLAILEQHEVQVVVLAGFMRVLSSTFLAKFPERILNIHPSLLPKYPGLAAIEQAMSAGEREIGCTVHLVDQGVDSGHILAQSACAVGERPLQEVKMLIHALEHALLPQVTHEFCGSLNKL